MQQRIKDICGKIEFLSGAQLKTINGQRGKQYKMLNYWFYPVHMLIIGALRMYFGI